MLPCLLRLSCAPCLVCLTACAFLLRVAVMPCRVRLGPGAVPLLPSLLHLTCCAVLLCLTVCQLPLVRCLSDSVSLALPRTHDLLRHALAFISLASCASSRASCLLRITHCLLRPASLAVHNFFRAPPLLRLLRFSSATPLAACLLDLPVAPCPFHTVVLRVVFCNASLASCLARLAFTNICVLFLRVISMVTTSVRPNSLLGKLLGAQSSSIPSSHAQL